MKMSFDDPVEVGAWMRERVLGSGGFGVVTLWQNSETNEMIALKKCRMGTDALLTSKHKERWAKEVEIMHRLCHLNVVKALSLPTELSVLKSELPMLCMEYCSKGDLRQVLNRSENCCGLREYDVRALMSNVKDAVQYLHMNKITHRDLKPENIVLQEVEGTVVYKLIDLGYAKELDQSSVCTSFVGTLQYLAPELFMSETYTYSVDYWSLGLVSHEAITGVRPFLPSMTPAEWMSKVREKSPDDICVYQDYDENIVFSQQVFPENHISLCLKSYVEVWLKCALQWDPKKRGRQLNGANSNIIVFDLLSDVLKKKIITIFCAPVYKELSYEIMDDTTVGTVLQWVVNDTHIPIEDLEVLSPKGTYVRENEEAKVYWAFGMSQAHKQEYGVMLYIYRRGELIIPEVKPSIPSSVCRMIQHPQASVKYTFQKRMWAHAVFFLQQERRLFGTFLHAYSVKVSHILACRNELSKLSQTSYLHIQKIDAQLELIQEIMKFDEQELLKIGQENVVKNWVESYHNVQQHLHNLHGKLKSLESNLQRVMSAVNEVQKIYLCRMKDIQFFDTVLDSAIKCYDSLKRRPKEVRQIPSHSMEMLKVIYNSLKIRDKLHRDRVFHEHLKDVVTTQLEIDRLMPSVESVEHECQCLQSDIKKWQVNRQHQLWNYIIQFKKKHQVLEDSDNQHVNVQRGNFSSINTAQNMPSINLNTASLPHLGPPVQHSENVFNSVQEEVNSVVQDNCKLRLMTVDMMNRSFIRMEEVLNDDLDWSWMSS